MFPLIYKQTYGDHRNFATVQLIYPFDVGLAQMITSAEFDSSLLWNNCWLSVLNYNLYKIDVATITLLKNVSP